MTERDASLSPSDLRKRIIGVAVEKQGETSSREVSEEVIRSAFDAELADAVDDELSAMVPEYLVELDDGYAVTPRGLLALNQWEELEELLFDELLPGLKRDLAADMHADVFRLDRMFETPVPSGARLQRIKLLMRAFAFGDLEEEKAPLRWKRPPHHDRIRAVDTLEEALERIGRTKALPARRAWSAGGNRSPLMRSRHVG